MLVASLLWTGPLVWLALCLLGILLFHVRRPSSLIAGISFELPVATAQVKGAILLAGVGPCQEAAWTLYGKLQVVEQPSNMTRMGN
jgi:hypothetical protein